MLRIVTALFCALMFFASVQAEDLSPQDKSAVQQVISGQLEAFKSDNGPLAFSFAAPTITGIFNTPENFMAMVKRGYAPIYNNQNFTFGSLSLDSLGRQNQHVTITAADGKRYEAVYALQKQKDGSWKISGCSLVEIPGTDV